MGEKRHRWKKKEKRKAKIQKKKRQARQTHADNEKKKKKREKAKEPGEEEKKRGQIARAPSCAPRRPLIEGGDGASPRISSGRLFWAKLLFHRRTA